MTQTPATLVTRDAQRYGREPDQMNMALRATPGAFYYAKHPDTCADIGLTHSCPCGCGRLSFCHLQLAVGRDSWTIEGPRDKPTLAPSVGVRYLPDEPHDRGPYHWHGWLRAGVWVDDAG